MCGLKGIQGEYKSHTEKFFQKIYSLTIFISSGENRFQNRSSDKFSNVTENYNPREISEC